jgi:hypothetical protein
MPAYEVGQQAASELGAASGSHGKDEFVRVRAPCVLRDGGDGRQAFTGVVTDLNSGLSWLNAAAGRHEQLNAELLLQLSEAPRQRRLGNVQRVRGGGHRAVLQRRNEKPKLLQIHSEMVSVRHNLVFQPLVA